MEQATNQFNKGLQMDTHPMVQGNDSLTDCLNGTLITMNGNEVILQNDMGNRRVDNAFLPAGYEPVGMKEYGGIIYVAAYNPITNKSQIGSFPSPERKISGMDEEVLSKKSFDYGLDKFPYLTKNINGTDYRFITGDTLLFPLTDKTTLHAGDKFTIYGNIGNTSNISNFHNIKNNKVYSPKNRLYTFSIGVLNSQNEFVDITKSLVRWDEDDTIHKFNETDTDLYKFNYQYFIPASFENANLLETMNDANFIEERQKIAANTYSYKLIGPLYLKVQLNHFQKFNYGITGHKNLDGNTFTIQVEGYYVYNCPDGFNKINEIEDDNYYTYEEGNPNPIQQYWFTLNGQDGKIISNENINYNPETNLYTTRITKTFEFNIPNPDENGKRLFKYYLNVFTNNHESVIYGDKYFFDGLSDEGIIDVDKLGSGQIELTGWRYCYNEETTELKYQLITYNLTNDPFTEIQFKFKNVDSGNEYWITKSINESESESGIIIKNGEIGLKSRNIYTVDLIAKTNSEKSYTISNVGWILTTELFNDCFSKSSNNYIADFRYPSTEKEQNTFNDKLTIKYELNLDVNDQSSVKIEGLDSQKEWLSKENTGSDITYKHTYDLKLKCSPKLRIVNEQYYPTALKLSSEKAINLDDFNFTVDTSSLNTLNTQIQSNSSLDKTFISSNNFNINSNNEITATINFSDIFHFDNRTSEFEVKNLFSNGCGYLEHHIIQNDNQYLTNFEYTFTPTYGGINVYTEDYGNLTRIEVRKMKNGYTQPNSDREQEENYENGVENYGGYYEVVSYNNEGGNGLLYSYTGRGGKFSSSGESKTNGTLIQEYFDKYFKNGVLIYWFHNQEKDDGKGNICFYKYVEDIILGEDGSMIRDLNISNDRYKNYNSSKKSRVWWRNATNNNWVLIYNKNSDSLLQKPGNGDTISSFLAENVFGGSDFAYCYRKNFDFNDSNTKVYAPDGNSVKFNDVYNLNDNDTSIKFIFFKQNLNVNIDNNEIKNILNFKLEQNNTYIYSYSLKDSSSSKRNKIIEFFRNYNNQFNIIYINYSDNKLLTSFSDKNGNQLDPGKVYKIDNNEFTPVEKGYQITNNDEYSKVGYNTILCNSDNYIEDSSTWIVDYRKTGNGENGDSTGFIYRKVPVTVPIDKIFE